MGHRASRDSAPVASDIVKAAEVLGAPAVGAALTQLLSKPMRCYDCSDINDQMLHCGEATTGIVCKTFFYTAPMSNDDAQLATFVIAAVAFLIAAIHVASQPKSPSA
jgi:hypothetical protein